MKIVWGRSIGWNIEYNRLRNPIKFKTHSKTMEYTIITNGCDCYPWQEVYAWWPVKTISGKRVWGRKLYKRKVWVVWGSGFHMEPEIQYADVFDLLRYDNTVQNKS